MPASIGYLVIDTIDPGKLAGFWCALLDVQVDATLGDGQYVLLSKLPDGIRLTLQRVPDAKSGKNRLHLDLVVDDFDTATAEIETLGGRWLEPGETRDLDGFRWRVMADPEGNEFDIITLPPA